MLRCPTVRTPILLYLVALAVRGLLIAVHPDPAYPDSSYYVDVARSIAGGNGLTVDVIWIFAEVGNRIPAHPVLPIPSNGHWLPLASFVQVPFILALGPTAVASALPLALIGSLAAPLTLVACSGDEAQPAASSTAGADTVPTAVANATTAPSSNSRWRRRRSAAMRAIKLPLRPRGPTSRQTRRKEHP